MSNEITMPKLSDTMEEGKIIRWLKHPGDTIRRGEPIAEVETDKADMVLESFEDGVLGEIKLKEGDSAPVGAVIAMMGGATGGAAADTQRTASQSASAGSADGAERATEAEAKSASANDQPAEAEEGPSFHPAMSANPSAAPTAMPRPPRLVAVKSHPPSEQPAHADGQKFRASPLARRAAEEAGVDLAKVRGTGPEGRVTKRDIDNFLREQQMFRVRRLVSPDKGAPGSHEELSRMRKTIAQRMAASKREIPHFYVTVEIDMAEAVKLKKSLEQAELFEEDITYNDIIVKATALAISRYPRMNASFENEGITIRPHTNIGVAVAVEDGLIVPVIRECERLTLPEIARAAHHLVGEGRARRLHHRRVVGRDVHDLEHGDAGRRAFRRGDRSAAGRNPGGQRNQGSPGGARRKSRGGQDHDGDGVVRPSDRRRRRGGPLHAGAQAISGESGYLAGAETLTRATDLRLTRGKIASTTWS